MGRWNPPLWRWNRIAARKWGAGIRHFGAGTGLPQENGALEPYPVWDFKNIKTNGVGWAVVGPGPGAWSLSVVVKSRCLMGSYFLYVFLSVLLSSFLRIDASMHVDAGMRGAPKYYYLDGITTGQSLSNW